MTEKLAAEIVKKSGIMRDTGMTSANPKPRAGEHVPDRFGLPEASYQDAMEMGNSLARGIVASPEDFAFDQRVLCRAFCLSAKEEILATQRWDTVAAERDELAKALEVCDKAIRGVIGDGPVRGNGTPYPVWADMISAAVQARAILAKHGR